MSESKKLGSNGGLDDEEETVDRITAVEASRCANATQSVRVAEGIRAAALSNMRLEGDEQVICHQTVRAKLGIVV